MNELLLTPGPTTIPPEVNEALINANIHHRTKEFETLFADTLDRYQELVGSPTRPIILAGTGTAAMDATLQNCCDPAEAILILEAGKFGERWIEIAESLDLNFDVLRADWGQTFDIEDLKQMLSTKNYSAVCCQYCETSTTALHSVDAIGKIVRELTPNSLFIVDGITAIGAKEVNQDNSHIDVLICGSQKALMLPPGIALLTLSTKAWEKVENCSRKVFYFNLLNERKAHKNNTTAFTPAINLVAGLNASLRRMQSEGLAAVYKRHQEMSNAARSGLRKLGFNLLAESCPAPGVTGGFPPEGVNADELRKLVLEQNSIRFAGGQGPVKGKIIRFGHMGATTMNDVERGISAIESALSKIS